MKSQRNLSTFIPPIEIEYANYHRTCEEMNMDIMSSIGGLNSSASSNT